MGGGGKFFTDHAGWSIQHFVLQNMVVFGLFSGKSVKLPPTIGEEREGTSEHIHDHSESWFSTP